MARKKQEAADRERLSALIEEATVDCYGDEEQFSGGGAYLFASVLEKFLGLYVSMNSFSQLVARSRQRKEPLEEWPPRAGQSVLI